MAREPLACLAPRLSPARVHPLYLVLVLALTVGACSGPDRVTSGRESAVLVTVDTWRADCFGAGGHPHIRTPHLDRFFRRGCQFASAYSPTPTTLASHVSLLTGQWPTTHGVPRNLFYVPPDVVTLAEILKAQGFRTAAYVSTAALDETFNLSQGFDVYDSHMTISVEGDYSWRSAAETLGLATRWWRAGMGRRFLWVHFFEPHFPYQPSAMDVALYDTGYSGPANGSMEYLNRLWRQHDVAPEVREHLITLYCAEITGLDRALGEFLATLAEDERTVTVLTADHGESLGEYGLSFMHGPSVFPHDVQVPLVVHGDEPFHSGVSGAVVRTIDVPAALLSQLGIDAPLPTEAGNLEDWAEGGLGLTVFGVASMPKHAETAGEYLNIRKQRVIRTQERALIVTPWTNRHHWYDRRVDPGELSPTGRPAEEEADSLTRSLEEWISQARVLSSPEIDPKVESQLRSLGYVY